MQSFKMSETNENTFAELVTYFRDNGDHEVADNFLIESGSLELCSNQSYHYSDESPSISEMKTELAFIRQQMIALKTSPERFTPAHSDAVLRALYGLASTALDKTSTDRVSQSI